MFKKHYLLPALALAAMSVLLTDCASLTGFQDGRTVGKNNGEFSASLNVSQSPDFKDLEDNYNNDSVNIDIPNFFFPNFEFGGRFGVGQKVDIGLRLNTNLNLGVSVKAQVVGDRESDFALALGAEVGTFGLISGLWNVQIPVYLSVHPTPKFAYYLSPRYIYQFTSYAGAENGASYAGGNTGVLLGGRNKFGIDIGYYRAGIDNGTIGLLQIGIGGKFTIGNN